MKLYTEEQVKSAFKIGMRENYIDEQNVQNFADSAIKYITPIELPSDEEIKKESHIHYMKGQLNIEPASNTEYAFKKGAKWMKEQIHNQNK